MLCQAMLFSMHNLSLKRFCFAGIGAGSLGCGELMAGDIGSREELVALQREDLAALGRTLLLLACAGAPPSLDYCAAGFSPGLTRALSALLAAPQGSPAGSWQQARARHAMHHPPFLVSCM